jgi:hypothetical protein
MLSKPIRSTKQFSVTGGSLFSRQNALPQLAETHFLDQMAFRSWRKRIFSAKWSSAASGNAFARPNGVFPDNLERMGSSE